MKNPTFKLASIAVLCSLTSSLALGSTSQQNEVPTKVFPVVRGNLQGLQFNQPGVLHEPNGLLAKLFRLGLDNGLPVKQQIMGLYLDQNNENETIQLVKQRDGLLEVTRTEQSLSSGETATSYKLTLVGLAGNHSITRSHATDGLTAVIQGPLATGLSNVIDRNFPENRVGLMTTFSGKSHNPQDVYFFNYLLPGQGDIRCLDAAVTGTPLCEVKIRQ